APTSTGNGAQLRGSANSATALTARNRTTTMSMRPQSAHFYSRAKPRRPSNASRHKITNTACVEAATRHAVENQLKCAHSIERRNRSAWWCLEAIVQEQHIAALERSQSTFRDFLRLAINPVLGVRSPDNDIEATGSDGEICAD